MLNLIMQFYQRVAVKLRKKQKITNASKDLTTTSKERIRQNKINSASRKCRQKQKIKSKLM